jgi:hypothetical protein
MATSAKQIAANRRNVRKSTGPRSPVGKAVSRHKANLVGSKSVPPDSYRESLQYYEMRLDRQLTHAYLLLHQLQHPESSKSPTILSKKRESTQNEPISTPPGGPTS